MEQRQVQLLKIVVASPGDVQQERDLVGKVAEELNRGVAADRGLRLEVTRWETNAYPGFHPEGPQGLIDPLLGIQGSDLVIGIFWKRFGTPAKGAQSGTEYEIRTAYEAWKEQGRPQLMVYFNQKPYSPQSQEEVEQWGRVLRFREEFPKEGLWWPYNGEKAFEDLLRNHLTQFIRQHAPISVHQQKSLPDRPAAPNAEQSQNDATGHSGESAKPESVGEAILRFVWPPNTPLKKTGFVGLLLLVVLFAIWGTMPDALKMRMLSPFLNPISTPHQVTDQPPDTLATSIPDTFSQQTQNPPTIGPPTLVESQSGRGLLHDELTAKGLLAKLEAAKSYSRLGSSDGDEDALNLFREVVGQLSAQAKLELDPVLLNEADNIDSASEAVQKYLALFKAYLLK